MAGELMKECVDKLLEISGPALCESIASSSADHSRMEELIRLAARRNGFYAFESALHVFPMVMPCDHLTAEDWNDPSLWKDQYGAAAKGIWCFAEDIFGGQFAIANDIVVSFDAEAGDLTKIADTVEEWACHILTDYEYLTGYPFAHEWQETHGPLPVGQRLVPKIPFIFGGEYAVANLYAADAVRGMRLRGDIYKQSAHLPDGARATLRVDRD